MDVLDDRNLCNSVSKAIVIYLWDNDPFIIDIAALTVLNRF